MLVSNGHSWLSIKQYTLNEIGIFLKAVLMQEERTRIGQFSLMWLAHHLNHKGYTEQLEKFKKSTISGKASEARKKKAQMTQKDLESEWNRFVTAISGLK